MLVTINLQLTITVTELLQSNNSTIFTEPEANNCFSIISKLNREYHSFDTRVQP